MILRVRYSVSTDRQTDKQTDRRTLCLLGDGTPIRRRDREREEIKRDGKVPKGTTLCAILFAVCLCGCLSTPFFLVQILSSHIRSHYLSLLLTPVFIPRPEQNIKQMTQAEATVWVWCGVVWCV